MIGRFMGAFALSSLGAAKNALVAAVPVVAFLLIGFIGGWNAALHYGVFLLLLLVAVTVGGSSAPRLLALFGLIIIGLLATGMTTSGEWAMWTVLAVGLFCSVMWSNIFSLAIEGLGPLKSQASSLLVMAILGGAVLPPCKGPWRITSACKPRSSCRCSRLPTWCFMAFTATAPVAALLPRSPERPVVTAPV